jgi:intracellular multiplication protein IcmL
MANEELQVVRLRDDFYSDGFYKILIAAAMVISAIGLLIAISIYLFAEKPHPVSFSTDNEWRVLAPVPLDQTYLTTPDLIQWVSTAVPSMFSYDFINYTQQLKGMTQYFTTDGWKKFLDLVNNYANYNTIQNDRLFVSATAAGAPFVINQGLLQGRYGWWVQMPISIRYSSNQKESSQSLVIQALVVRVSTLNNLYGVGIDNILVLKQ